MEALSIFLPVNLENLSLYTHFDKIITEAESYDTPPPHSTSHFCVKELRSDFDQADNCDCKLAGVAKLLN